MSEQEPPKAYVEFMKAKWPDLEPIAYWVHAEDRALWEAAFAEGQRAQAEKDAEIADAEMVSGETGDAGDVGYNRACEDIESAIRAAAPKGGE